MTEYFRKRIEEQQKALADLAADDSSLVSMKQAADAMVAALAAGGQVLLCGNGGSASDAQHIAAELVGRFGKKERRAINAEALTVNTSSITAIANDWGYDRIFERQVEAKGKKGDVIIGISTSGGSPNILHALSMGRSMGLVTIGLTGADRDSAIADLCDHCIFIPSTSTPRIQEAHILIGHAWCEYIESHGDSEGA